MAISFVYAAVGRSEDATPGSILGARKVTSGHSVPVCRCW